MNEISVIVSKRLKQKVFLLNFASLYVPYEKVSRRGRKNAISGYRFDESINSSQTKERKTMGKKFLEHPMLCGIYFIAVPLAIALQSNWLRLSQFEIADKALVLGWWVVLFFMFWWLTILTTQAIRYGLKILKPPVWIIWVVGPPVATLLFHDIFAWYFAYGHELLPEGAVRTFLPDSPFTLEYLEQYVCFAPSGIVAWIGINALFDKVFGIPMFRSAEATDSLVSNSTDSPAIHRLMPSQSATNSNARFPKPEFLESLPADRQGNLIYVQAQEHFIRVCTDKGTSLISCSFKKALAELSGFDGVQSHRSYWISNDAILDVVKNGHGYVAKLKNGLSAPVSRTYLREVRNIATGY